MYQQLRLFLKYVPNLHFLWPLEAGSKIQSTPRDLLVKMSNLEYTCLQPGISHLESKIAQEPPSLFTVISHTTFRGPDQSTNKPYLINIKTLFRMAILQTSPSDEVN